MASPLPEGLVSTHQGAVRRMQREDDIEALARCFHKVYAANRYTLADGVGRRLENYFWRVWSNPVLMRTLTKDRIKEQFDTIREGGDIRNTPKGSPRTSRSFLEGRSTATSEASPANPTSVPIASQKRSTARSRNTDSQLAPQIANEDSPSETPYGAISPTQEDVATPTASSPFRHLKPAPPIINHPSSVEPRRPPPILKRTSTGESDSPLDRSLALPPMGGGGDFLAQANAAPARPTGPKRQTTTRFKEEVLVSTPQIPPESPPRSTFGRSSSETQQTSRRRATGVVKAVTSRRKPTIMRRQPSQTSHPKVSITPPGPGLRRKDAESSPQAVEDLSVESETAATLPLSYRAEGQKRLPTSTDSENEEVMAHGNEWSSGSREKGRFRVETVSQLRLHGRKTPQQRSFTNPPALDRKSSAVTSAPSSYQASGLLDLGQEPSTGLAQGREAYRNETIALKEPAPTPATPLENQSPTFPRTKSQLTLLLERKKADKDKGKNA